MRKAKRKIKKKKKDNITYRPPQVVSWDFYFLGISTDVRDGRCPSVVSALIGWGGGRKADWSIGRDVLSKLDKGFD
jgi:hypothetical protein